VYTRTIPDDRGTHRAAADVVTGLVVHRSARVEALLGPLVESLHRADPDPFVPMRIVVASHGMRRWLSHQLAQRLDPGGGGVLANVEFPFPGRLVREIVTACGATPADGGPDGDDPWDPQRLAWNVARVLLSSGGDPPLATVARDLDDERAAGIIGRRTWRLARGVADVFNDYVVHRADMVTAWARGEDLGPDGVTLGEGDRWQPWLWRALLEHVEDPARRIGDALEVLQSGRPLPDTVSLPRDVAIFGLSTLPPRHLDLLAGLARHTTVEWYVPTPSPGRWNTVSRAVLEGAAVPDARHPLLASCGRVTDDAALLVTGHTPIPSTSPSVRAPSARETRRCWAGSSVTSARTPRCPSTRLGSNSTTRTSRSRSTAVTDPLGRPRCCATPCSGSSRRIPPSNRVTSSC